MRFVVMRLWGAVGVVLASFAALVPAMASAHEVYVLPRALIAADIATSSPNPFGAFTTNEERFFFWGFVALVTVATVFWISLFHTLQAHLSPILARLKPWAPTVVRLTLGSCLIASAYFGALFGPELPLGGFGPWALPMQAALYAAGAFILVGLWARLFAAVALGIFCIAVWYEGSYMLTYLNYLGEMLLLLILGAGARSFDAALARKRKAKGSLQRLAMRLEPYAFLVMRVGFGGAVLFAALYAKFLHSTLALNTVTAYGLTNYFPFDPLFVVLGAFIVESLIGIFIILGVEVRWTAIFFLFWLTLSLWYFGEAVWPHLVLLGLNLALICHGYDRYTLEGRFLRAGREPVL